MTIEINGLSGSITQVAQQSGEAGKVAGKADDAARQAQPDQGNQGDTVELTATARQLNQLEEQLRNQPVVDVQRVAEVSRAIDNGTLEIDPSRIATRLIRFESYLA